MPYRILSLDGGGPWALIQACALQDLYPDKTGHEILAEFDLAIANSGGSITLAGLLKNLTPAEILELFLNETKRRQIFVKRGNFVLYYLFTLLRHGARWSAAAKLTGLRALFNAPLRPDGQPDPVGDLTLAALPGLPERLQVIITGFDYDQNREVFFRRLDSPLQNLFPRFVPSLAGAVHASSNAPIAYFDAPALVPDTAGAATRRFWDGAIGGYNNPVLRGVIEALANVGTLAPEEICALSIGTGSNWQPAATADTPAKNPLFVKPEGPGPFTDLVKIATAIEDDPPDAASIDAHVIMRAPNDAPRLTRLSPITGPELQGEVWALPPGFAHFPSPKGAGSMPAMDAFTTLLNMPMDAVDQPQVEMIHTLALQWIAGQIGNQPILRNQTDGTPIIGHRRYADAKAAWQACRAADAPAEV